MSKKGGSADKRITGHKLQALRRSMYIHNPHCNMCKRLTAHPEGYQLDHIKPLHKGGTHHTDNLQILCHECHAKKTAQDLGHTYTPKKTIGLDGWPVD